jgi:predicted CXXCH cytochrome family protein
MRLALRTCILALLALLCALGKTEAQKPAGPVVTAVREADASCAECHRSIYREYLQTPMANASGLAMDRPIPGTLSHKPSGVDYEIAVKDNSLTLSYQRPGDPGLQGHHNLLYFLGSGHLGVTYMYSLNGFLLESPVAYYASLKAYDMKPGLGDSRTMPAGLPMSSACMRCHMSGVQSEDRGTFNHYRGLPFEHGGITCESCHGDSRAHVASRGRAAIINPLKLDAERRDSICIRCHLEGDTSVDRKGRSSADYKPGERIEDYLTYFVYAGPSETSRGVSETEELAASKCKRMSGDGMSCMSCHDPHNPPAPQARAAFYRAKCLACHTAPKYASAHYSANQDCTSCHMPNGKAENIPHVAWTDHRIRQHPDQPELSTPTLDAPELVPFLKGDLSQRDLALAYSKVVVDGKPAEASRAWNMLLEAAKSNPDDPAVLDALGYLSQAGNDSTQAINYYRASLQLDPSNLSATNNLATLLARSGDLVNAAAMWQKAFDLNQDIESLGLNLSLADCKLGERVNAQKILREVLVYSPDSAAARQRLKRMDNSTEECSAK